MANRIKERFIPMGAVKIASKTCNGVVYLCSRVRSSAIGDNTVYIAYGFSGKRSMHDFCLSFRCEEKREKYVTNYFNNLSRGQAVKAERRAELKAQSRGMVVGDILYASWGYEQTNIDFYQVTDLVGLRSVKVRKIGATSEATGYMSANVTAIKDAFIDEAKTKLVRNGYVKMDSSRYAYKWDGKPKGTTSYH